MFRTAERRDILLPGGRRQNAGAGEDPRGSLAPRPSFYSEVKPRAWEALSTVLQLVCRTKPRPQPLGAPGPQYFGRHRLALRVDVLFDPQLCKGPPGLVVVRT